MINNNSPYISIIIATLNASKVIERCLKSIINQTNTNFELILIDGGSTDGTQTLVKKHINDISFFVSEPDSGIYNAWNKALEHAKGDWICFLGADDYFWNNQVLDDLIPHLNNAYSEGIKVVYGQAVKVDKDENVIKIYGKPWSKISWLMKHGMALHHTGIMHHKSLFETHGNFDETFRIAGDYDLLLRELKNGRAKYIEDIRTVGCQIGGLADSSNIQNQMEFAVARKKNGFNNFSWVWWAVYIRALLRRILL
ncbi:MAG: glycosyltransferase [Desulfobacteraceae bacterium]|nr:glycosyltransferase [Desulfobacteraceae bacterium]